MNDHFGEGELHRLFSTLCSTGSREFYYVNPSTRLFTEFVDWGVDNRTELSTVNLLAQEWTLKNALDQFTVASHAAELLEHDVLNLSYVTDPPKSTMMVDRDRAVVLLDADGQVGVLSTTNPELVAALYGMSVESFANAEQYLLHTPPWSRIESTLDDRLGSDCRMDFVDLVDAAATLETPIDEVILSLVVAARNEKLLYDVSKWGEDIGLASKATFSRKKTILEEAGIIETDSEPIEVGRPRLRLQMSDPELVTAPPPTVVDHLLTQLE